MEAVTHLEKTIAGEVTPVTHLEQVIAEYGGGNVYENLEAGTNIFIEETADGKAKISASGEVSSEDTVARAEIAAIKDGETLDSFGDVETALDDKADSSTTYTKTEVDTALGGKQNAIDSSHKLSADLVDDTSTTNKFATAAELEQIETNKNNISTVSDANGTKNLLDFNDWASKVNTTRATKSISKNSITLTATGGDAYTDGVASTCPASGKIACEPNTTYVITWETTSTSISDNVYIFPANASPYYRTATTKYIEYTMPAGCKYFTFRFGVANSGDTVTYSNIMICEKSLYDISNQYKSYALSNAELTTKEKQNENNISKLDQKTISPTTVDNKKVFTIPIDTQAALIPISVCGDSTISDSALLAYNGLYDTKSVKIIDNITSASVSAVESAVYDNGNIVVTMAGNKAYKAIYRIL